MKVFTRFKYVLITSVISHIFSFLLYRLFIRKNFWLNNIMLEIIISPCQKLVAILIFKVLLDKTQTNDIFYDTLK